MFIYCNIFLNQKKYTSIFTFEIQFTHKLSLYLRNLIFSPYFQLFKKKVTYDYNKLWIKYISPV